MYPKAKIHIPNEVQNNLKTIFDNFAQLRKDRPGAFCVIISCGLVTLSIAGHLISGTWLVTGTLIGILFLCAKYKLKIVHYNESDDEKEAENMKNTSKFKFSFN